MEGELLFLSSSGLLRLINQLFLISNKNVLVLWTKKRKENDHKIIVELSIADLTLLKVQGINFSDWTKFHNQLSFLKYVLGMLLPSWDYNTNAL